MMEKYKTVAKVSIGQYPLGWSLTSLTLDQVQSQKKL